MAGDWIKIRCDLQTHPKVVRILSAIRPHDVRGSSDKFRVIGGLHAVWTVFDQHSTDGRLPGYTPEIMDHVIGFDGLSQAMIDVGWLVLDDDETLVMPEFHEHNGKSGKRRAEDQKRKRDARRMPEDCPQSVRNLSAKSPDQNGLEKRREDSKDICQSPTGDRPDPVPHQKIIELYHQLCPSLPRVAKLTPTRQQHIRARWRNELPDLESWSDYFGAVQASDFLSGRTPPTQGRSKPWVADIDFLIKQSTVVKMAEGKYD